MLVERTTIPGVKCNYYVVLIVVANTIMHDIYIFD